MEGESSVINNINYFMNPNESPVITHDYKSDNLSTPMVPIKTALNIIENIDIVDILDNEELDEE